MPLKDVYSSFAASSALVAGGPQFQFDTHHNNNTIYFVCINVSPYNLILRDDQGLVRGYAPNYTIARLYLNPRPQFITAVVDNTVSTTTTGTTPISASSATAASANNVTLPAVAGQTNYVTGFQVTGTGATSAAVIAVTLTGVVTGTNNYVIAIPASTTTSITPLQVTFNPPLPASAVNTAITLNVPSFGSGNTNAAASIQGYVTNTTVTTGSSVFPNNHIYMGYDSKDKIYELNSLPQA